MHAYVIMDRVRCCVCCESVGCWARDPAAKTRSWPNRKGGKKRTGQVVTVSKYVNKRRRRRRIRSSAVCNGTE
jgi:hypothetical protein